MVNGGREREEARKCMRAVQRRVSEEGRASPDTRWTGEYKTMELQHGREIKANVQTAAYPDVGTLAMMGAKSRCMSMSVAIEPPSLRSAWFGVKR